MNNRRSKLVAWLAPILGALALVAAAPAGIAAAPAALRCAPEVSAGTTGAAPLSPLARARRDCPILGAILEEYATLDLGEAFPEETKFPPSPELVVATRFAALGDIPAMTQHARLAREAGAKPAEIRELLYLTTVSAGIAPAMEATRALAQFLTPEFSASVDKPARIIATSREACLRQMSSAAFKEN